jgi:DNA-binding NarL/FixJ family response regulator
MGLHSATRGDADGVPTRSPSPRICKLVLVDKCSVMREGLCALIEQQPDLRVVAQAATVVGVEPLDVTPDVIVTDVDLPDARYGEVINGLGRRFPLVPILALTLVDHPAKVRSVLAAGAGGYLLKTAATPDLLEGIRALAGGGTYLQPSVRVELERWHLLRNSAVELTPKEEHVLRLVARGHTNAEVARLQGVSRRTVETHRGRIYQKLGLRTRAELFEFALDNGLVDRDARFGDEKS